MKYVIASDLHGSNYYANKIVEIYKKENAQKLILLGDIYNHGPRNVLPTEYNPMEVSKTLNAIKSDLVVIKGNCDSQVDTMISDFDFIESMVIGEGERIFYLTHGHGYNKDNPPKTNFYGVIYGHFHTGFIKKENGVLWVNTGSLSLPKNGTVNSYLLFEDGKIYLKDLTGKIIDSAD